MIWWGNKINKKYAWEISGMHMLRQFSDGITFFEVNINFDKYRADHTPRFDIMFVILNFKIIEFSIYNMWHEDNPNYDA